MKLETLLKKRQRLEAQIAAEHRLQKRRAEVLQLIEKAGALTMSDDQILAALTGATPPVAEHRQGDSQ